MSPKHADDNPLPPALLNQKDAAHYLAVSVNTFKRRIRPFIACVELGGAVRYSVKELDRWIEEQEEQDRIESEQFMAKFSLKPPPAPLLGRRRPR